MLSGRQVQSEIGQYSKITQPLYPFVYPGPVEKVWERKREGLLSRGDGKCRGEEVGAAQGASGKELSLAVTWGMSGAGQV